MENTKAIQIIINKAWIDDNFRQDLVNNPKDIIVATTGEFVPDEVKLVVADQTDPTIIYINIPPKPNFDNMELSEEQLEQVAGGEVFFLAGISMATAAVTGLSIASGDIY